MTPVPRYPPTDYSRARPLPREILFPTTELLEKSFIQWSLTDLIAPVINLAKGLAVDHWRLDDQKPAPPYRRGFPAIKVDTSGPITTVGESRDLKVLDWSSYEIMVDGTKVVLDFGDWHLVNNIAHTYEHWLRFHFHSSYKSYPWLGSFPPANFKDWATYDRIQREVRAERDWQTVTTILNNQHPHPFLDSRRRRRFMVQGMLRHYFGDRVDFGLTPQDDFYTKAKTALCYVAVPGSWENILDRGQLQMIGLGVPTISPVMIDQCCDGLLQPGIHYLACRQDYLDVPELIGWCEKHRGELAAMSHNAWMFFQEFCTPIAVWSYVKDRIDNGPRHWRISVDDDLSPPALHIACAAQ
jgi:hypothetical protein